MLLNISNHPSSLWSEEQLNASAAFGSVIDMPFPDVDPYAGVTAVSSLAEKYLADVIKVGSPDEVTVHLMGEFCFTFSLLLLLKENGYTCVASTTRRNVIIENGMKKVCFEFCSFREYWCD